MALYLDKSTTKFGGLFGKHAGWIVGEGAAIVKEAKCPYSS